MDCIMVLLWFAVVCCGLGYSMDRSTNARRLCKQVRLLDVL